MREKKRRSKVFQQPAEDPAGIQLWLKKVHLHDRKVPKGDLAGTKVPKGDPAGTRCKES